MLKLMGQKIFRILQKKKLLSKSVVSDYCMMLSIVDQSFGNQEEKLKCLLFAKEESKLPPGQVGDVIRFHRLTVSFPFAYNINFHLVFSTEYKLLS